MQPKLFESVPRTMVTQSTMASHGGSEPGGCAVATVHAMSQTALGSVVLGELTRWPTSGTARGFGAPPWRAGRRNTRRCVTLVLFSAGNCLPFVTTTGMASEPDAAKMYGWAAGGTTS